MRRPNRRSRNKQKLCRLPRAKFVTEHHLDVQQLCNYEASIVMHLKDLQRIRFDTVALSLSTCLSLIILQFHLLIACIFLNTKRQAAISEAQNLLQQYPTPETLAKAQYHDIQPFFAHLGVFRRAHWLIKLANVWLVCPPQTNKLHTKRGGKSTFTSEVAHLQGVGTFANNAWRIFCKDDLYIRAGYPIAIPEWKKVLPTDEGLVAYLHNRWDKEGFTWDESTGVSQKRGAGLLDEETAASTDTIGRVTPSSSI